MLVKGCPCINWLTLTNDISCLEQWKRVDTSDTTHGMRRLDHCNVITSGGAVPRAQRSWHSKPDIIYINSLESNTNQPCGPHELKTQIWNPTDKFMPLIQYNPWYCSYLNTQRMAMFIEMLWTRWPRRRFSRSYVTPIWVTKSIMCEFRVTMGILTGLLGRCYEAPVGSWLRQSHRLAWVLSSPRTMGPGCFANNAHTAPVIIP